LKPGARRRQEVGMTGKRTADIVFCIDASASMTPCIQAVGRHLGDFINRFGADPQTRWDLRFDFLAHSASTARFNFRTLNTYHAGRDMWVNDALYHGGRDLFFTQDAAAVRTALESVEVAGDEAPLVALDMALDFPWRADAECHRVVILLTDEPLETSLQFDRYAPRLPDLVRKIMSKRVLLYLATPDSAGWEHVYSADKCDWTRVSAGAGLADVDFGKLLEAISKSVSKAIPSQAPAVEVGPLYGQDRFGRDHGPLTGA
jgi:hypothetical protein